MLVDGSRHTVEARPQVNNPADYSNQDGTGASGFSSFLFLLLSIPVAPANAASPTNAEDPSLSQSALFGGSRLPKRSVPGDGAGVSEPSGVQAEDDHAVDNRSLPVAADSAQSIFGAVSSPRLAADIEPQNGIANQALQSANGNHEINNSGAVSDSLGLTNFASTLARSDGTLAAEDNGRQSSATPQPLPGGNQQAVPAEDPSANTQLDANSITEAAQPQTNLTKPSEVVSQPEGAARLQKTESGLDVKKLKLFVAAEPPPGKMRKVSVPATEEPRGKLPVQPGKETLPGPLAAEDSLNDFGAESGNGQPQNPLESKEEKNVHDLDRSSAKTANGEFNNLIGDKTSHEAAETDRDAVQRSNETLAFVARPAVMHEAASAPADATPKPWRPVVERIAAEMVGRIKLNRQDAIIQLDPPELGKIKIDLHIDGDKLQARIFAEGHESQSLIENHLQELRQALQANHVNLTDVRIQGWHGTAGDAMQSFPQQQQQQTGRQEWAWGQGDVADGNAVEAELSQGSTQDKGRVSMWA